MASTAQHSTAQHSTLRQLTKRIVQVTAFSASCLVVIPSFTQTADAQSCPYNGGCVTGYGNGNTPIEDWSWISSPYSGGATNYGNGSSGGGGGGNNIEQEHADYCEIVSNTVTMFSGMRVVSTADSLLTLGGMAGDYATLTM